MGVSRHPVDEFAMDHTASDVVRDRRRVAVLRDLAILDSPAEMAYDDIARLATACCQSPIAAVNFVDDERHWTKSIVGVAGGQGTSVSADISFCAATIATDGGLLSLSDTSESERWCSHPLVEGPPFVGFYAGAAIVVSGQPIGVVCVVGSEPRELGEREEMALVALARQASAHLELRKHNADLRTLAVSDPLTGLANRTLLFDHLEMAIAQRRREGGHVGVLFCDVDDFKLVNDRGGHEVGDRVLCEVAERLREATRSTDTVARIAGDEFVVLCPGLDTERDLDAVIERVDRVVSMPGLRDDGPLPPVMSIGAVLVDGGRRSPACRSRCMTASPAGRRAGWLWRPFSPAIRPPDRRTSVRARAAAPE